MPPICRHPPGYHDRDHERNYSSYAPSTTDNSPDADKYDIEEAVQVGQNLVLKVKYPNCAKCAYEGNKVLVYIGVTSLQAMKWKKIDPHFKDPKKKVDIHEAPAPAARFPASSEGWQDALDYAARKR